MHEPYYKNRLQKSKAERKKRRHVRPLSQEIEAASKMLIITIGCMLLFTTVSFLYVSSLQAAKGYQLKQLQLDHEQLLIDNRELQSKLTEAQSLNNVEDLDPIQEMVDPESNEYSYVGEDSGLALR